MSSLIEQKIMMVRVDGEFQHMPMTQYEKLAKDSKYHAYSDHGLLCLDSIKELSIIPTLNQETLPPPPPVESNNIPILKADRPGRPKNLHYHYKAGKQTKLLEWEEIDKKIKEAYLTLEQRVYFVITMFVGARKEEVLELVVDSIKYNDTTLYIDIGKRLKGSESTDPIPIDRSMPYVEDIIKLHTQRSNFKPTKKLIIRFGKIYTGVKKGKDRIPVWSRVEKIDRWMFLNISRTTAINIFKKTLGSAYYPHYGRLWMLSNIGTSPQGNIIMLKSISGIKSTQVLNAYLGQSEQQLKKGSQILTSIVTKVPNIATNTEPQTSS